MAGGNGLKNLCREIKACRLCVEQPVGPPLPHDPRPVLQVSRTARIGVFGQAPGVKVHISGRPFTDPSGVRLRSWMGISEEDFYDAARVAVLPMGFCFPGYSAKGADLPPRSECAPQWRQRVLDELPSLQAALLVGRYAQAWHLGPRNRRTLSETVAGWRQFDREGGPRMVPLPHPSWRNNAWLKRNPWFEAELLPDLRALVGRILGSS
ncbi:MAG: uracil-DNA glycosylase family protein [Alphaproteobacteria bacterium]|nr:uracil-DNA glycosylase family protein [Alphaproteobacteria bacterium]